MQAGAGAKIKKCQTNPNADYSEFGQRRDPTAGGKNAAKTPQVFLRNKAIFPKIVYNILFSKELQRSAPDFASGRT